MADAAATFRRLHEGPAPLRLVNAWDALSARVFELAGAPAVATSSFAVGFAHGYADGEQLPWPEVCRNLEEIAGAVDIPVSIDVEAGRDGVERSVADVAGAGAVGVNLEDRRHDESGRLFEVDVQCERIAAARAGGGADLFINARCDVFFGVDIPEGARVDAALERAARYLAAGADGIFLPGLVVLDTLRRLANDISAPLNVMLWPGLPSIDALTTAGVRRISQGAASFLATVGYLEQSTRSYLNGEPTLFAGDIPPAFHLVPQLTYR